MRKLLCLMAIGLWPFLAKAQENKYPSDSTKDGKYYLLDSGQVVLKGNFEDTVRTGIWREYDKQGIITKKYKYKKGKVIWMKIYRNGIVYQTIDRKGRVYTKSGCGC